MTLFSKLNSLLKQDEPMRHAPGRHAQAHSAEAPHAEIPDEEPRTKGHVIGVIGAKGGAGATVLAINLAAALAVNRSTTLIDANFQQPDVSAWLGQEPPHSLSELINRAEHVDKQLFDACCVNVSPKLNVLSPLSSGEFGIKHALSRLAGCLDEMNHLSKAWVIDLPRTLDKHFVSLADRCDKIVIVFEPTITSIAGCRRWLDIFTELGYGSSRLLCVLNRASGKQTEIERHISDNFGGVPIVKVPNVYALLGDSCARGEALSSSKPNHAYSKAIADVMNLASPEEEVNA